MTESGYILFISLLMYGLAIIISLLVAVLIKGIVRIVAMIETVQPASPPIHTVAATAQDDIAAITAAVYAVLGAYRIVHIEHTSQGRIWTAEGRVSHHASHAPHQPRSRS